MSHSHLVSIVVAAFNAAQTVADTLESLLKQTYSNVEIIVVDDGSTDATPEVLRRYDERIRVVRQANKGLAAARNAGCRLAKGEFIALMDADDLCAPDRVALQVGALLHFPDAVICASDFSAIRGNERVSWSYGDEYYSEIGRSPGGLGAKFTHHQELDLGPRAGQAPGAKAGVATLMGHVYPELAFGNFIHPPTVMFRRAALFAAGLFDESIRYNCDWECFVRVSRLGPVVHICLPLLDYRLSASQMSVGGGAFGVEIVAAFEKVCHHDTTLAERYSARVLERRREFSSAAASTLVEHDRVRAARMLWRRVSLGGIRRDVVLTAAKCLMPASLRDFIRRRRTAGTSVA